MFSLILLMKALPYFVSESGIVSADLTEIRQLIPQTDQLHITVIDRAKKLQGLLFTDFPCALRSLVFPFVLGL